MADVNTRGNLGVMDMIDVTPSDSVDLPDGITRGIYCTSDGNVKMTFQGGSIQTLALTEGTLYSFFISRIWSTSYTGVVKACY